MVLYGLTRQMIMFLTLCCLRFLSISTKGNGTIMSLVIGFILILVYFVISRLSTIPKFLNRPNVSYFHK